MKFGIYCNIFNEKNINAVEEIKRLLKAKNLTFCLNENLHKFIPDQDSEQYKNHEDLNKSKSDILITIGGDGTILSAVKYVYGSNIPVFGVNTGRLGYLTSITLDKFEESLNDIINNKFQIEERSLIEIETSDNSNEKGNLALNEISVLKKNTSSMITIHAKLDGKLLNTYWADGLIISTATGSTAYSLSCGGPIIAPGSGNLIITPIAPHNLNVRPLVVQDSSIIELTFEDRSSHLLLALDSDSRIISDQVTVKIKKAKHKIGLLRSNQYSYLETLRSKLNWGLDKRN